MKERTNPASAAEGPEPIEPPGNDENSRIVARPDGFHWVADDGRQEFGPFPTAAEALAALRAGLDSGLEPDEALAEVEAEIGIDEPLPPDAASDEQ